jgi:hypothetical protein
MHTPILNLAALIKDLLDRYPHHLTRARASGALSDVDQWFASGGD